MNARIVLAPGYWLGAWAWDAVVPELSERGFDVKPLTLPGLEPGRDSTAPEVTLADQASAIETALDVPAGRRILVVHSGGRFRARSSSTSVPNWWTVSSWSTRRLPVRGTRWTPNRWAIEPWRTRGPNCRCGRGPPNSPSLYTRRPRTADYLGQRRRPAAPPPLPKMIDIPIRKPKLYQPPLFATS